MGHCNSCGAPCPNCVAASEYTLMRLKEPIRAKVKKLLEGVGAKTNDRVSRVVASVAQYDDAVVDRAFRIWNSGSYASEGKDERYFLGILRSVAIAKRVKLDSLPPLIEDDYDPDAQGGEGIE